MTLVDLLVKVLKRSFRHISSATVPYFFYILNLLSFIRHTDKVANGKTFIKWLMFTFVRLNHCKCVHPRELLH